MRTLLTTLFVCTCYVLSAQNKYYTITFGHDAVVPDENGLPSLSSAAQHLAANVSTIDHIVITGFTDTTGSVAYNIALSKQRANYVQQTCINAIPDLKNKITVQWYGETSGVDAALPWQQRSVVIEVFTKSILADAKPLSTTEIIAAMKLLGPKPETYEIAQHMNTTLIASKGTIVSIPGDCFEIDPADEGKPIAINITEYYSYSDLILGGYPTTTANALLETSGSVHLEAHIQGKKLKLKKDKKIKLGFSVKVQRPDFQLFNGVQDAYGFVQWQPTGIGTFKFYKDQPVILSSRGSFTMTKPKPCPYLFCGMANDLDWLFGDSNRMTRATYNAYDWNSYRTYLNSMYSQFGTNHYPSLVNAVREWNKHAEKTATYVSNESGLGMMNCDRFTGTPVEDLTKVIASVEKENNTVGFLVFHAMNSVMQANEMFSDKIAFSNIGKGFDCTLVMVKISGEDYYVCCKKINDR